MYFWMNFVPAFVRLFLRRPFRTFVIVFKHWPVFTSISESDPSRSRCMIYGVGSDRSIIEVKANYSNLCYTSEESYCEPTEDLH